MKNLVLFICILFLAGCRKDADLPNLKTFSIEEVFGQNLDNIYQGQEVDFDLTIKSIDISSFQTYEIQFLSLDDKDLSNKSKILLEKQEVFLGKWIELNGNVSYNFKLLFYHSGIKNFVYRVRPKNSEEIQKKERKIEIKSYEISLENLKLNATEFYVNEPFSIQGIISTLNTNKNVEYKTWITEGNNSNINTTNNIYKQLTLTNDNFFETNLQANALGKYVINIQVRDIYGNESGIKSFPIEIKSRFLLKKSDVVLMFVEKISFTNKHFILEKVNLDLDITSKERVNKIILDIRFEYTTSDSGIYIPAFEHFEKLFDSQTVVEVVSFKVDKKLISYILRHSVNVRNVTFLLTIEDKLGAKIMYSKEGQFLIK